MLLIVVSAGGSVAPCAAPLFFIHMEHSHSSCSSVVFSCLLAFRIGRRSMVFSLCTIPVAFLGGAASCVFVSTLMGVCLFALLSLMGACLLVVAVPLRFVL